MSRPHRLISRWIAARSAVAAVVLVCAALPIRADEGVVVERHRRELRTEPRRRVPRLIDRTIVRSRPGGGAIALAAHADGVDVLAVGAHGSARTLRLRAPVHDGEPACLSTLDVQDGIAAAVWVAEAGETVHLWIDRVQRDGPVLVSERERLRATERDLGSDLSAPSQQRYFAEASSHTLVSVVEVGPVRRRDRGLNEYDNGYLRVQRVTLDAGAGDVVFSPVMSVFPPSGEQYPGIERLEDFYIVGVEPRGASAWVFGSQSLRSTPNFSTGSESRQWLVRVDSDGSIGHSGPISPPNRSGSRYAGLEVRLTPNREGVLITGAVDYSGSVGGFLVPLAGRVPGLLELDRESVLFGQRHPSTTAGEIRAAPAGEGDIAVAFRAVDAPLFRRRSGRGVVQIRTEDAEVRTRVVFPRSIVGTPVITAVTNGRERFVVAAARGRHRGAGTVDAILVRGVDHRGRARRRQTISARFGRVHELAACDKSDTDGRAWMLWSAVGDDGRRTLRLSRLLRPRAPAHVRPREVRALFERNDR